MAKTSKIEVDKKSISIIEQNSEDYICLTDMVRGEEGEDHIRNWMRNRNTVEFIGLWEILHNPDFKPVEFDTFRKQAGQLGKTRENFQIPLPTEYLNAFEKINADQNQELIVVENENSEIIGTMQLSFIQYLTYRGGVRAQIEAVRIRRDLRGLGIGKTMIEWAISRAKERDAHLLQLTTDKKRPKAIRFYEDLGFKSTHEGMKMHI